MRSLIAVELSMEVRSALDDASRAQDVSPDEIIERALKQYFFVSRFRQLRAETRETLRNSDLGDLTDDDVFRLVS